LNFELCYDGVMAINIPWFEPCQEKKRIKKKGKKKAK
jgi:hypothetical protein